MAKTYIVLTVQFFSFLALFLGSCKTNSDQIKKFSNEPYAKDYCALYVHHEESTGSADVYIDRGELLIPDSLKTQFESNRIDLSQLKLSGKFDFDLIDNSSFWYDSKIGGFYIIGNVVGISSSVSYGKVPLFQVVKWKAIHFSDSESIWVKPY